MVTKSEHMSVVVFVSMLLSIIMKDALAFIARMLYTTGKALAGGVLFLIVFTVACIITMAPIGYAISEWIVLLLTGSSLIPSNTPVLDIIPWFTFIGFITVCCLTVVFLVVNRIKEMTKTYLLNVWERAASGIPISKEKAGVTITASEDTDDVDVENDDIPGKMPPESGDIIIRYEEGRVVEVDWSSMGDWICNVSTDQVLEFISSVLEEGRTFITKE